MKGKESEGKREKGK